MKKTIALLLITVLSMSLAACGGKNKKEETENTAADKSGTEQSVSTPVQAEKDSSEEKEEEGSEITFDYSHKIPGKNIVIDVPNYQEMDLGFTQLYILHGVKYVAITAHKLSTATELSAAHEEAFALFKEDIQNYSYVNSLTVTSDSTETINGIEVYKYEGTLNCALDYVDREWSYDAYVIGYSFIMDGVPCTVTGSVIDQAQDPDMIEEMKATVEAMIQTLRSER